MSVRDLVSAVTKMILRFEYSDTVKTAKSLFIVLPFHSVGAWVDVVVEPPRSAAANLKKTAILFVWRDNTSLSFSIFLEQTGKKHCPVLLGKADDSSLWFWLRRKWKNAICPLIAKQRTEQVLPLLQCAPTSPEGKDSLSPRRYFLELEAQSLGLFTQV